VSVAVDPAHGSTFTVFLPAGARDTRAASPPRSAAGVPAPPSPPAN
jgi:hypothetical protein